MDTIYNDLLREREHDGDGMLTLDHEPALYVHYSGN